MSKILFEKIHNNRVLNNWTRIFNNTDELIEYMKKHKTYLLEDIDYEIRIREVKDE